MSRVTTTHWSREDMDAHLESLKTPATVRNEARLTDQALRGQIQRRQSTREIAATFGVSIGFVNARKRAMGYPTTTLVYEKRTAGGVKK